MRSMTPEELQEFLGAKEHWIVLTTIGQDGFPHSVPLGYFLYRGDIISGCKPATQKVKNVERNPRVSLLLENGRANPGHLKGILLRGEARIVRDDAERLELKREACRQRGVPLPDEVKPGSVYIRVTPSKTVSWIKP